MLRPPAPADPRLGGAHPESSGCESRACRARSPPSRWKRFSICCGWRRLICSWSPSHMLSFRDGPKDQTRNLEVPGSLRALERRRLKDRRLADRLAKGGFKKIEVAAFIGLLDVLGEHPAIAALEPRLRLLPLRAALVQLGLGHIEVDGARGDIERDLVAVLHQRERAADIGF